MSIHIVVCEYGNGDYSVYYTEGDGKYNRLLSGESIKTLTLGGTFAHRLENVAYSCEISSLRVYKLVIDEIGYDYRTTRPLNELIAIINDAIKTVNETQEIVDKLIHDLPVRDASDALHNLIWKQIKDNHEVLQNLLNFYLEHTPNEDSTSDLLIKLIHPCGDPSTSISIIQCLGASSKDIKYEKMCFEKDYTTFIVKDFDQKRYSNVRDFLTAININVGCLEYEFEFV